MISIGPALITENVLTRVSSYDIFKKYCPNFRELNTFFKSEFREENNSSVRISVIGNDLLYKDFGEKESYRAIPFVARKFNTSYRGALEIINRDFELGLGDSLDGIEPKPVSKEVKKFYKNCEKISKKDVTTILVKRREFNLDDLSYWGKYYWTKEMLQSVDIAPISHFWIIKPAQNKNTLIRADKYAYTFDYYYHNKTFRRKIYQPYNKIIKFVSNVDFSIVQGYKRLHRTGEYLFITSSLKDCGPFWRLGYDAVAPNSETTFLPDKFINKMKKRFKHIIIWFDNDWDKSPNPGIESAQKYSEMFDIPFLITPNGSPKDPSDFCKRFGLREFNHLINENLVLKL
jgi:hypothetical protein